jgi:hypothetical protein
MDKLEHYSTEQLIDYLEGRLDDSSSAELSQHLESGCMVCNDATTTYRRMLSAIETLHQKSPSYSAHKKVIQAYSDRYASKPKIRWQPYLRPAFISFTVLVLITFVFLFNLNPSVVYAGYLENVTGQVEMFNPTTGSWDSISTGQSVPVDATIRTLTESKATLKFPGGEQTILGSNSEVDLLRLTQTNGLWEITLELMNGQTENQTAQDTDSFSVRTQTGIAHSDNAHFVMKIFSDGSAETRVLEGQVEVRTQSQSKKIHSGETTIFPSPNSSNLLPDKNEDYFEFVPKPSTEGSETEEMTVTPTGTPKDNFKPTRTPTPRITPISSIPTNSSENSTNSDIDCSPGSSDGAGNSENASNSDKACK